MEMFDAADEGDLERVKALAEQDAALVHALDDEGGTPLVGAAYHGQLDVARYLLDHGATINHRDHDQKTALHWALSQERSEVAELLVQRGADLTAADHEGRTPLMSFPTAAIARMLLEHGGADIDAVDNSGRTSLFHAWPFGTDVLSQLLEAGADPTVRDNHGHTAGEYAATMAAPKYATMLKGWERAYLLQRVRRVRDASSTASSSVL